MDKEKVKEFANNYDYIEKMVYKDNELNVDWLFENGFITERETKDIKYMRFYRRKMITRAECESRVKDAFAEEKVRTELKDWLFKVNAGCGFCENHGCEVKRMCAKRRISVDKLKWMSANGAGGGSLPFPQIVEIPEVCANDMAKGLGMTLSGFIKEFE